MLKSKKGFTLLELIVALGFATIIFLVLFYMKASVDQVERATSYTLDNSNTANAFLSDFQSDFKSSETIIVSANHLEVTMTRFDGVVVKWQFDIVSQSVIRIFQPGTIEESEKVYVNGDLNTTVSSTYFTVDDPAIPTSLNVDFNLGEIGTVGNDYSGTYHINSDLNQLLIQEQ